MAKRAASASSSGEHPNSDDRQNHPRRRRLARHALRILKGALFEWYEDKVPRMAAAIAFYAVFSLAPIVVIAFKFAEFIFGREVALREIVAQAVLLIGKDGAEAVQTMIESGEPQSASLTATTIGICAMIFATTGVFTELKDALNTIWEVQPKPGLGIIEMIRDRFFAFAMVLVIWFLMLISLVVSTALSAVNELTASRFGVLPLFEPFLSLVLITCLFALMYRVLPDVSVAWHDVWLGALTTAALFVIGKSLFGLYLGHSSIGSNYGAAGSLVIINLWTYYSCLILLFGAEITQVQARLRHAPMIPDEKAVHVTEHQRVQQGIPRTEEIKRAASEQ